MNYALIAILVAIAVFFPIIAVIIGLLWQIHKYIMRK